MLTNIKQIEIREPTRAAIGEKQKYSLDVNR
jgi:hypothetical protein